MNVSNLGGGALLFFPPNSVENCYQMASAADLCESDETSVKLPSSNLAAILHALATETVLAL